MQRPTPATLLWLVTLTFYLQTLKWMIFQDSSWKLSMSSLTIIAASVFEIPCSTTDTQMDAKILPPRELQRSKQAAQHTCQHHIWCQYRWEKTTIRQELEMNAAKCRPPDSDHCSHSHCHTHTHTLASWSLTSPFNTNMAISETKGQGWTAIPTQWRKASDILTSTLAAFLSAATQNFM